MGSMQELREKTGLVEEVPSLHFLEFLWGSSRYAYRKEPNDEVWRSLFQIDALY